MLFVWTAIYIGMTTKQSDLPVRGVSQVEQWRAAGKEPYAYSFQRTHLAAQLQTEYADLPAGEASP